jgi:hypothetical protein
VLMHQTPLIASTTSGNAPMLSPRDKGGPAR